MKILVLGCGYKRFKGQEITYLDNNSDCKPDILWDLEKHPLPFKDREFDRIYAHHILEHLAQQGDYKFFFKEFEEYWRILKLGGLFQGVVPMWNSAWAWGDPSHKRVIQKESLVFLDQSKYSQVGQTTMSDFCHIYKANFKVAKAKEVETKFSFVLQKVGG